MRDLKGKTLSSEQIFNEHWFKVRRDKYITPAGKIVDPYYVYEFPDWVTALALTEDGKVIMVRQYRHGLGETCLELPGGCVDKTDKDFAEAVSRELLEETGYSFETCEFLGKISPNPSTNNNLMYMYLAKGGRKVAEQSLDPNEEIEVVFYSIAELKQLLKTNAIIQSMHVACILYGLEKLGELKY